MRIRAPLLLLALLHLTLPGCGKPDAPAAPPPSAPQGGLRFSFVDVAGAMGYRMRNRSGRDSVKEFILEAMPPGIAVADYDRDGWMDLFCPNGNDILAFDPKTQRVTMLPEKEAPRDALYWNRKGKKLEEGGAAAGVDDALWSFGACAADVDNDGWPDIYLCNWGVNRLFRNRGDGTFEDVAAKTRCDGDPRGWSTGAAFFDYDRDGDLDLYVAQYADIHDLLSNPTLTRVGPDGVPHGRNCDWRGLKVYCGPLGLRPQNDVFYRNLLVETGRLDFEDVTRAAGMWFQENDRSRKETSAGPFYGFQPTAWDIDGDGWQDLFVANDSVANTVWMNRGDGTFENRAMAMSLDVGPDSSAQASMGVGLGDVNRDGLQDLVITNFSHDQFNLTLGRRLATGAVVFDEKSMMTGFREMSFKKLGWGTILFDPDLDMDLDVFCACGHVYPEVDNFPDQQTAYRQTNLLVLNEDPSKLRLRDVSAEAGPGLQIVKCTRSAVRIDFDNDGDMDVATTELNDTPCLLRCDVSPAEGPPRFLRVRLVGSPKDKVPLDPAGAVVTVTAGGVRQAQVLTLGSSFLSCEDPRLLFGLGSNAFADSVEVLWPDGRKSALGRQESGAELEIRHPSGG
jgi:hypothetical protein